MMAAPLVAIVVLPALALAGGALLAYAERRCAPRGVVVTPRMKGTAVTMQDAAAIPQAQGAGRTMPDTAVVDAIDALLPQTQCGQCGHPGCRPYAAAIAAGGPINKCPPGGAATILALARLLDEAPAPLDPEHGVEGIRKVAFIREAECIGCTKCIQACPVDAILGSAKHMHTVIASECTGCDLCVDPCPVDCIDMLPAKNPQQYWHWPRPHPRGVELIATDFMRRAG